MEITVELLYLAGILDVAGEEDEPAARVFFKSLPELGIACRHIAGRVCDRLGSDAEKLADLLVEGHGRKVLEFIEFRFFDDGDGLRDRDRIRFLAGRPQKEDGGKEINETFHGP